MAQFLGYSGPLLLLPEAFGCHMTISFLVNAFIRKQKQKWVILKSVWFVNFFYIAFPKRTVEQCILVIGVIQNLYTINTDIEVRFLCIYIFKMVLHLLISKLLLLNKHFLAIWY